MKNIIKNRLLKIVLMIFSILMLLTITSNAADMRISVDKDSIKPNEEVIVSIKTDTNIETTTLYLKYDSSKLEYVKTEQSNVMEKDYPEEGTLRVVYYDITLTGINELSFKFKAKDKTDGIANIEITNLTTQFVNDSEVYTNNNMTNSIFKTEVNIQKQIPITNIIIIVVVVIVVLLALVLLVKIISKNKKTENKKVKTKKK